jgi:hypothetical protein
VRRPAVLHEATRLTNERAIVTTGTVTEQHLNQPRTGAAFRNLRLLVSAYLGLSVLSLLAIVLLRNNAADVNSAVWTHGTIVLASASLTFAFTVRAARGSRRAYLRLRIVSAVMVVAIAVIVAIPGDFPLWMKIEQGVCGLILLAAAVIVNSKHMRSVFAVPRARPKAQTGPRRPRGSTAA